MGGASRERDVRLQQYQSLMGTEGVKGGYIVTYRDSRRRRGQNSTGEAEAEA